MAINKIFDLTKSYINFFLTNPSRDIIKIYQNYLINKLTFKFTKKRDMSSEIFFWEHSYYKNHCSSKRPPWWSSRNPTYTYPLEMTSSLESLHEEFGESLELIDVGSGPISMLINKLDINRYTITTVDPLANTYNYLNSKYNIPYTIKCIEGTGENLDELFPTKKFHLAFSQNSIDHSEDPMKYIKNLRNVLKPNGIMYLSGSIREGTAESWIGLHQHDLFIEGEDLCWMNRFNKEKNLTEYLDLKCLFKSVGGNDPGSLYTIIYKKK